jgi:hypothetical protein
MPVERSASTLPVLWLSIDLALWSRHVEGRGRYSQRKEISWGALVDFCSESTPALPTIYCGDGSDQGVNTDFHSINYV